MHSALETSQHIAATCVGEGDEVERLQIELNKTKSLLSAAEKREKEARADREREALELLESHQDEVTRPSSPIPSP